MMTVKYFRFLAKRKARVAATKAGRSLERQGLRGNSEELQALCVNIPPHDTPS